MSAQRILPVAMSLAGRPLGMSNGELAREVNLTASAAGAYLQSYLNAGHIFKGQPEGKHARYFATEAAANDYRDGNQKAVTLQTAGPDVLARAALAHMRKDQICSSMGLAQALHVTPEQIDAALAPLADTQKLTRVAVKRSGIDMFDYRFSAAWVPKSADFEALDWQGATPRASVSPIAAPKAMPAPAPRPLRVPAPVAPARPVHDALAGGPVPGPMAAQAASLGFAVAQPPAPELESATLNAVLDPSASVTILEADDLVCAINSRGELALDLGECLIKFRPAQARQLQRFLAGMTILENLCAQAAP